MEEPTDNHERVRRALGDGAQYEVPVLPEVARAVLEATRDASCEPKGIAELLRRDAAMSAGVLRAANSPAYAPRAPIVTLPQAISRLGFDTIRRIALLVACDEKVFCAKGREAVARTLYFHSTLTAFVAQEIARRLKDSVEDAFIAGLLHDIGKSLALQAIAKLESAGRKFSDEQATEIANVLHARVGAEALEAWGLPKRTLTAVAFHHAPHEAPRSEESLSCLVSLANEIAHVFAGSRALDAAALEGMSSRLATINFYEEDLHAILSRRDELLTWARGT